jgi:hypothetical protein
MKVMGRSWEGHGRVMGRSWEGHWKVMGRSLGGHWKVISCLTLRMAFPGIETKIQATAKCSVRPEESVEVHFGTYIYIFLKHIRGHIGGHRTEDSVEVHFRNIYIHIHIFETYRRTYPPLAKASTFVCQWCVK